MKNVCAHYISTYLPLTENWIFNLLKNLDDYEPFMLCRDRSNFEKFTIDNIKCLSDLNQLSYYYNFGVFKTKHYFPAFKKACLKKDARILHIHFGYHGIKSIGLKKQLKIPMVCSFYGNDAYINHADDAYYKRLKILFSVADKILVLGPKMHQRLKELGCPESRIHIQHLGINVDKIAFKKRSLSNAGRIRFLIASSFVPKKGIDDALTALSLIKEKVNFSLDIIGDGFLNDKIRELVRSLNLADRVTFHGYQPYNKVISLAYESHVLLQASKTASNNDKEGTPMIIADVMATGMPVITTYHSDIPEMVIDGETGFLAEENSPSEFARAILKLIKNNETYEACSMNSRKHVENEFNTRLQGKKLEALYDELCKN